MDGDRAWFARPTAGRRAVFAGLIVIVGAVLCLANDRYWQSKVPPLEIIGGGYPPIQPPTFDSVLGDLVLVAFPFYLLAAMVLITRVHRLAVAAAFAALTVLTVFEFRWDHLTDSSTASLAYLAALIYGIPIVVLAVVLDRFGRELWRRHRGATPTPAS